MFTAKNFTQVRYIYIYIYIGVKMYETLTSCQPRDATDRFYEKPSVSFRFVGGTGTNRNTRTHAHTHSHRG
jgi:hypothetical protein